MSPGRSAVFLDRDGTINVDTHFPRSPAHVSLIAGAAAAIVRLNDAGLPVIVVSNQSGIGRGLVTMDEYESVRARIAALLAAEGARIDATYICPHAPPPPASREASVCECRKPGTLLYRRAAAEHGVDLAGSWYIGDRWRDVAPAIALRGHGILVPGAATPNADLERARSELRVAPTLADAVSIVLSARDAGSTLGGA